MISEQSQIARFKAQAEKDSQNKIWQKIEQYKASFDEGCLLWLTQYTATEDNHWMAKGTPPVAPFPRKEYFVPVLAAMIRSKRLFIPKSREMMTSWLSCGYIAWMCQWFPTTEWVMQTEKEDKVVELVNYCRILYRRQQPWMSERVSICRDNATELVLSNGSHIVGVPKGANQIRLFHPYGVLFDEAAFLPEFGACYDTAHPVAKQIIAVSSAGPGRFADECQLGISQ